MAAAVPEPATSEEDGQMTDRLVPVLLYICAALFPVARGIEIGGLLGTGATSIQVTAADVLAWPVALYIVILRAARDGVRAIRFPPLPAVVFLAVGLLGFFSLGNFLPALGPAGPSRHDRLFWAKEFLKMSEIFLAVPLAFLNAGLDTVAARRVALVFFASCAAIIAYAAFQHFLPAEVVSDFRLGSLFGDRNAYGAFLAVAVPALAAFAIEEDGPAAGAAAAAAAVGLATLTSGGAAIGVAAGILAVTALGRQPRAVYALGVFILAAFLLVPAMPRDNPVRMWESIRPFKPAPGREESAAMPSARLRGTMAALNLLRERPIRGVGLGNYQRRVTPFYEQEAYPKPMGRTDDEAGYDTTSDEPGSQSMWLVIACETGLPGLMLLAAALAWWAASGARAYVAARDPAARALALAAVGAVAGAAAAGLSCNPLVRGTGVSLALLASLGTSAAAATGNAGAGDGGGSRDRAVRTGD
ncbi:MAG: O-antigen ligase family protein [Planctomycetota bacterium]|nr:O-antigen ligase family protein [Planctomycetota bacterium]